MKSKQFISGVIIGAILATSVSTFAADFLVSVIQKESIKIYVDGDAIDLKDGGLVFNHEGVNYTSARSVAESLGATVEYARLADGSERIDITPKPDPEPEIVEVPVEVIVEVPVKEEDKNSNKVNYYTAPAKDNELGVSMLVNEVITITDFTYVKFDLDNRNDEDIAMFDTSGIELVTESGRVYKPINTNTNFFLSSFKNNYKYEDQELLFSSIPVDTKFTLTIPMTRTNPMLLSDKEKGAFEFNLIVEEYEPAN